MRLHHALPQVILIIHGISILVRLAVRQSISVLPEHITAGALRVQRRSLPGQFDRARVTLAKLLEHARLAQLLAHGGVILDPVVTPLLRVVGSTPALRVQVVDAEVHVRIGTGSLEITSLCESVRVRAVALEAEAFLARGDHVFAVERLDVRCRSLDPVGHHAEVAALAARLVGELPCEDGGRGTVAAHYGLDIRLILGLSFLAAVPLCVGADAGEVEVSSHAAVVSPIVDEVDDELDAMLLGALDNVVKTLEAIGAGVDLGFAVDEGLVVDGVRAWVRGHIVETPDAEDLQARAGQVRHDKVNIVVVRLKAEPVGVRTGIVLFLAIDDEVRSGYRWE